MSISPKPILLSALLLFVFSQLHAQNAWINEFHYDNDGGDEGEFVEVVIEDASSYDLSSLNVSLYNGSDGEHDDSFSVDAFTEGDTQNNFTIYYLAISGIQNGAPDGLSLDYNGSLIQFISYEGDFTAVGGPADGEISEDVGVEESGSTLIGESLQLSGSGTAYGDFTWQLPAQETPGQLNNGQTIAATCAAPTTQAIFLAPTGGDIDNNQITLNWTRGDGDAVVILANESSAVDDIPQNGTTYSSSTDFNSGSADEIGTGNFVVYDGNATSVDIMGLTQGTEYHFSIFEYLTPDQCYLTEIETISVTTTSSFDDDSDIQVPASQVESGTISSIANAEGEAVDVFSFEIQDRGSSDGVATFLNKMVIEKSSDNSVSDWSSTIKGAKFRSDNGDLVSTDVLISQDQIEFDLVGNELEVADGTSENLTLSIWLQESQNDGDTLGFQIPENHGFEENVNGSLLNNPISSAVTSNSFGIEVEASHFEIVTTSSTQVNEAFALSATAVDANGNTDFANRNISLSINTGSGNLSSPSVGLGPLAMNNGYYEWTDLEHDTEESIIIQVSDGNGLAVNAPEIEIIPLITTVFFSEYIEGSSSNKAFEIFNNSGDTIDLNDFSVARYTNGSESITSEYELSEVKSYLADQAGLVIAYAGADEGILDIADTTSSIAYFNGDDVLALLYKGTIIDVIGEVGVQPSNGWEVAGVSEATQNKTLVRKASVIEGNPNYLASFGSNTFDSEWIVYDKDDFSFLGRHFRCEAPTEQTSNLEIQNISTNSVELNWNTPANLESLVLIQEEGAVDAEPVSGIDYTGNTNFTLANAIGAGNRIVFSEDGDSVSIANLRDGTNYHIAIYAKSDSCYNLNLPVTGSFTTAIALDDDSEINDLAQPDVSNLLSTADQEGEAVDVFSFQISDLATQDTQATIVEKMVFEAADANSLAWENTLNAILKDENGKVHNAQVTIEGSRIEMEFPENQEYEIPSGESVDFTLGIWFNRFQINDTAQFALKIPVDHEFSTINSGSSLANNLTEEIVSIQIAVTEVFDPIHEIRNGATGTKYAATGYVSSHDFGISQSKFYIQNDDSSSFEAGIAVFSDEEFSNLEPGSEVKIYGRREVTNGSIYLSADTVIFLNSEQFIPETYPISPNDFNSSSEFIGTRVQLDSLLLVDTHLWGISDENILRFLNSEDSILVKIQPNTIFYDGNVPVPLGAVDLAGVMEVTNDSIQLFVTLNSEISDSYDPVFEKEPAIANIESESVTLTFAVNELCTVYYAIKNADDSIPALQSLKNPQTDGQIINSGLEQVEISNVKDSINVNISGLASNTAYSIFVAAEDTLGNANEIRQLDFFTLNADADEDVKVVAPVHQVAETPISAIDASQNFVSVFNFTVEDGGTNDELSTYLRQMVIQSSAETEVSFNEVIAAIELVDLSNEEVMNIQDSIFSDSIVMELDEIFELADGDSNAFQLRIRLQEILEDEQNLAFEIPSINSGWEVEPNGSQLANDFAQAVVSSIHSVDVVATELCVNYPSVVYVNENFNVSVSAQDQNGNLDLAQRELLIETQVEDTLVGQTEINLNNGEGVFEGLSSAQAGLTSFEITDGSISEIVEINFIEPELELDTNTFSSDFELITYPEASEIQSYQLSAEQLKDSIVVVSPDAFKLSLHEDFTHETDTLIFDHNAFSQTEIFVRFSPSEGNGAFYQDSIIHFSQDADTIKLMVSGQEGTLSLSSIASVRNKQLGERVKIQGVVIGGENHFENRRIIQDESAGIAIVGLNTAHLNFGDSVEVEGVLNEINSWHSIIPEEEITMISSDSIIPEPMELSISDIADSMEFQRVKIKNLSISSEGHFQDTTYRVYDENDTIIVNINSDRHPLIGKEIPVEKVNVSGFISKKQDRFHIYPELEQDLEIIPRDTLLMIRAPEEGLNFGNVLLDEYSEPESYSLEAQNLAENLRISVSENFEVSLLKNSNYSSDLILPINNRGDIPEINIYIRFSPIAAKGGEIKGDIMHFSGGQEYKLDLHGVEDLLTPNTSFLRDKLLIFPNPVDSELVIKLEVPYEYRYQLVGANGSLILRGKLIGSKHLNLSNLEKGVYFLQIFKGAEKYLHRIIKK